MSTKDWEGVIERFYRKYKGVALWHEAQVRTATQTGVLEIPTGRSWQYESSRDFRGELKWPITTIKNYPVQGLEADLMALARVSLFNRIKKHGDEKILLVNSVHDSLLLDAPRYCKPWLSVSIAFVFRAVRANFIRLFGVEFNLPFRGELLVGMDWLNMEEVKNLDWG